jgi:hypothetical protein
VAHKIRVKRVPHINKDGTPSKSKVDYFVSCQSRGKTCVSVRTFSQKEADLVVADHRHDSFITHRLDHPNDLAHRNKHDAGAVTAKQVPSRFAPIHLRGLKHATKVEEWKKKFKPQEKESA